MAELKECDIGLLETRLKNLTASIETMDDDGDIRATKKFMEHVRDYMAQLLELLRRPSPSTAPLTLEELRKMDGEPVYIVAWPDWGHWELSADAEDYLADRDPEFYGMKYADPAGRYGLHVMGWLAYRRKP